MLRTDFDTPLERLRSQWYRLVDRAPDSCGKAWKAVDIPEFTDDDEVEEKYLNDLIYMANLYIHDKEGMDG